MATNEDLAELLFPDVTKTIEDLEREYPLRNLPEGAQVTRFAPSPTGFLHTGSLFTSMISYTYAGKNSPSADIVLEFPADLALKLNDTSFLLVSGQDCYITRRVS